MIKNPINLNKEIAYEINLSLRLQCKLVLTLKSIL